jgi:hypothetical protein
VITFPIRNLFIEGPDCSGKTTLVRDIHNSTDFRLHIHDRSQISRKIFSDLYNRDLDFIDDDLHAELSNLNNRFIFLLPPFNIIRERYIQRGDDFHSDISSIRKVYDAFLDSESKFSGYPNVRYYITPDTKNLVYGIMFQLNVMREKNILDIAEEVNQFVNFSGGESYPLSFTIYDNGKFENADSNILKYEPEAKYYEKIFTSFHEKITNELNGKNEYNRREDYSSRRFVHTNDSCISFIQASVRNNILDFHVVIRSSDVKRVFQYDMIFLYYLASTCFERFSDHCSSVRLRFNLNSAHIIE